MNVLKSIIKIERVLLILIWMMISIVMTNCSKDADNITSIAGTVDSISPISGPGDTEILIKTSGISSNFSDITVFFNNKEAVINSATNTEIKAIVPRGALTGTITIVVDGQEITGPEFTYIVTPAQVITVAGSETLGNIDGPGAGALFIGPTGISVTSEGTLYITEYGGKKIRKIAPDNTVTSIIGKDIAFTDDWVGTPHNAIKSNGNIISCNVLTGAIEEISPLDGTKVIRAGNQTFSRPMGICIDQNDNIYVSVFDKNTIQKITPADKVTTYAGTGIAGNTNGDAATATFSNPRGSAIDPDGNIYIADSSNSLIRKISSTGAVSTYAGTGEEGSNDGTANTAQFSDPSAITIDTNGNLYISDTGNHSIRKIATDGIVSTYAGTGEAGFKDGIATEATFNRPQGLVIDADGVVYVTMNHGIRKILPEY